jgi:hypothetical protein
MLTFLAAYAAMRFFVIEKANEGGGTASGE